MATLREYFETDFSSRLRIDIQISIENDLVDAALFCDFEGLFTFPAFYVAGTDRNPDFLKRLIHRYASGAQFALAGPVKLPGGKEPEFIHVENSTEELKFCAKLVGDADWTTITTKNIPSSRRLFIYCETSYDESTANVLKTYAKQFGYELIFRADAFVDQKNERQVPAAFISYDSRNRDIAKSIAINLKRKMCHVWYDEFSLQIGDDLRQSIEKGLKECKKCILILSKNFFSNSGWTKTEFDSLFTRQILEDRKLFLPIWCDVSKHDVYQYSPSLANVVGKDWQHLGEEEICNQIYRSVTE